MSNGNEPTTPQQQLLQSLVETHSCLLGRLQLSSAGGLDPRVAVPLVCALHGISFDDKEVARRLRKVLTPLAPYTADSWEASVWPEYFCAVHPEAADKILAAIDKGLDEDARTAAALARAGASGEGRDCDDISDDDGDYPNAYGYA